MATYAVVKDGNVINMIEWDGSSSHPDSSTFVEATADSRIGGTYDGSFHFVEPTPPEPTEEQVAAAEAKQSAITKLKALGLNDAEVSAIREI